MGELDILELMHEFSDEERQYFKAAFGGFNCDIYNKEVTMVDMALALRDSAKNSYVISNPCLRYSDSADERSICGLEGPRRIDACQKHYLNLLYLADTGQIPVKDLQSLSRYETYVAHLPEHLYWRFIQKSNGYNYPRERRVLFVNKVRKRSKDLQEILKGINSEEGRTPSRLKLLQYIQDKVENPFEINFDEEVEKYVAVSNIGSILSELDLIRYPNANPTQTDNNDIEWLVSAKAGWGKDEYVVFEFANNEASATLMRLNGDTEILGRYEFDNVSKHPNKMLVELSLGWDSLRWNYGITEGCKLPGI